MSKNRRPPLASSPEMGGVPDPLRPSHPNPFDVTPNILERGTVISVDAASHTYRVHLHSGRTLVMSRIMSAVGDHTLLTPGTPVVVTFGLGAPYILGVLPQETATGNDETPARVTDVDGHGGNDPLLSQNLGATARGVGEVRDIGPGDRTMIASDNQASVSALRGGVAVLRASPLAKIEAFANTDTIQIVAGLLRLITWMGESRIINENGKTSFIWRGGSDQLTQTGHDEERYTIRLDLGHTGNLAKFEITTPAGQPLFSLHVNPQGKLEIYAAGGRSEHIGGDDAQTHETLVHGNETRHVSGSTRIQIDGDTTATIGGSRTETVDGNDTHLVGNDLYENIAHNRRQNIANTSVTVTGGDYTVYSNGNVSIEALGSGIYSVKTNGGSLRIESNGGPIDIRPGRGTVTIHGGADCIKLGGAARSHAVKYEELAIALQTLTARLDAVNALIASHVHPVTLVPAPSTSPSPTLAPITAILPADISSAKASTTLIE